MFAIARNGFLTVYDDDRVGLAPRVETPAIAASFHSRTVTRHAVHVAELSLQELVIW